VISGGGGGGGECPPSLYVKKGPAMQSRHTYQSRHTMHMKYFVMLEIFLQTDIKEYRARTIVSLIL
jgi:hypothetical protein